VSAVASLLRIRLLSPRLGNRAIDAYLAFGAPMIVGLFLAMRTLQPAEGRMVPVSLFLSVGALVLIPSNELSFWARPSRMGGTFAFAYRALPVTWSQLMLACVLRWVVLGLGTTALFLALASYSQWPTLMSKAIGFALLALPPLVLAHRAALNVERLGYGAASLAILALGIVMGTAATVLDGERIALALVIAGALACVPEQWMRRRQGGRAPARRTWTPSPSTFFSPAWNVLGTGGKEHYSVALMALFVLVLRFACGFPAHHVPQVALMSLMTAALLPRWTVKATHAPAILARLPVAPTTVRANAIAKGLAHGVALGLTLLAILALSGGLGITAATSVLVLVTLATTAQIAGVADDSRLGLFAVVLPPCAFAACIALTWKLDPTIAIAVHGVCSVVAVGYGRVLARHPVRAPR